MECLTISIPAMRRDGTQQSSTTPPTRPGDGLNSPGSANGARRSGRNTSQLSTASLANSPKRASLLDDDPSGLAQLLFTVSGGDEKPQPRGAHRGIEDRRRVDAPGQQRLAATSGRHRPAGEKRPDTSAHR